jgi:hypothetical protein
MATPKRYPLPKRFNAALSEEAYDCLRSLNEKYGYGNNYLLTILLENLNNIADQDALEKVFEAFKAEYGAPAAKRMKKDRKK